MSLQALLRVEGQGLIYEWESNLFGHCYDLFESVKKQVGHPNPHTFASNEDGPEFEVTDGEVEELEAHLDDPDKDAYEILTSQRGPFCDPQTVIVVVRAYKDFFESQPPDKKFTTWKYDVPASIVAEDLANLEAVLLPIDHSLRVRIYVG